MDRKKIATYYNNARQLVKQNNPKEARVYVLAILNSAVETYKKASTILTKAKTQAFLDKWIKVSQDLYAKGITDFVLESFGLIQAIKPQNPKTKKRDTKPKAIQFAKFDEKNIPKSNLNNEIDVAGLIDETSTQQGWCADVFESNKNAVVEISINNSNTETSGTGFIISEKGYLLTNDHVVYNEQEQSYYSKIAMSFIGSKKRYKLEVLTSNKQTDVALCRFQPEEVGQFGVIKRISDYSQVLQGADCLVIGNAFGMGLAPFTGIVRFTKNDKGNLVYTAPSNPGDSGGPVLNRQGECIGINKSKTRAVANVSAEGYNNATPMDKIEELLKKWCSVNKITL